MSIKDKSLKLAAVSRIADEAKKAKDRLRAELQEEMDSIGADRVKAELGDETVAYIMTTKFAGDGRETLRSAIVGNAIDARKVLELE